jgi:hypothetical protein
MTYLHKSIQFFLIVFALIASHVEVDNLQLSSLLIELPKPAELVPHDMKMVVQSAHDAMPSPIGMK